jgi:hypothetical protein
MSPVPPAISSMVQPEEVEEEEPGLMLRTKWSLLEFSVARRQGKQVIESRSGKHILTSISGGYRET